MEAMKLGAADYLGKPLSSPNELRVLVRRILDRPIRENEREILREDQRSRFSCTSLITEHPCMQRILDLARKAFTTTAPGMNRGHSQAQWASI